MEISPSDRRAYSEIYYIINNLEIGYRQKLPNKLVKFFEDVKDDTYEVPYDESMPLYMQEYQDYTFDLLNILNVNYWCDDNQKLDEIRKQIKDCDGAFKLVESASMLEEEKQNNEIQNEKVITTIHGENTKDVENIQTNNEEKRKTKDSFFKNLKNIFK